MKIKIDWRKALKITADFFRPLVKPFVAALVGGGVESRAIEDNRPYQLCGLCGSAPLR